MIAMRHISILIISITLSVSFGADLVRLNTHQSYCGNDMLYADWIYYILETPPDSGVGYPPQEVEGRYISLGEVLDPEDFSFQYGRVAITKVSCWYFACTGDVLVHISNTDYMRNPYNITDEDYEEYWSGGPYSPGDGGWYDIDLGEKVVVDWAVMVHFQYQTNNAEYYLGFDEDTSGPWYGFAYHSDDGEWYSTFSWGFYGDFFVRALCETVAGVEPTSLGAIRAVFK